jgi:serine/threonine protein kinase
MGWKGWNHHSSTNNEPSFEPLIPGIPAHLDDYGFTFDRDDDDDDNAEEKDQVTDSNHDYTTTEEKPKSLGFLEKSPMVHRYSSNYSTNSSVGCESSIEGSTTGGWPRECRNSTQPHPHGSTTETPTEERDVQHPNTKTPSIMVKHILYIQMQFCSQKTLADFLSNAEARKGGETSGKVDIPYALSLFLQIAQGVQHVHSQGLIHRDLKPNNCFIDDAGAVKVGDFGLSRESANDNRDGIEPLDEMVMGGKNNNNDDRCDPKVYSSSFREITAGVGTRSYASPEQMKGSDYDSSTDIYSLGIILFELCYPMYTVSGLNCREMRSNRYYLTFSFVSILSG